MSESLGSIRQLPAASCGRHPGMRTRLALALLALVGGFTPGVFAAAERITAELREVSSASWDGREFLDVRIHGLAGPRACRGDVLRVEKYPDVRDSAGHDIEATAMSAVLRERTVLLTIPLDADRCIDGMPTIADMRMLPVRFD